MRTRWILLIFLISLTLVGCSSSLSAQDEPAPDNPQAPPPDEAITNIPENPLELNKTPESEEMPSTPSPAVPTPFDDMPKDPPLPIPANPGLQALIERAKADLALRLSIQTSQIKVTETKEVFWPDASLGCPQTGIVYAQTPTPGYLIMLEYAGNEFEYHAGIRGDTLYCENPTPPMSGTPADINPLR